MTEGARAGKARLQAPSTSATNAIPHAVNAVGNMKMAVHAVQAASAQGNRYSRLRSLKDTDEGRPIGSRDDFRLIPT
jgi:hypothetical protein